MKRNYIIFTLAVIALAIGFSLITQMYVEDVLSEAQAHSVNQSAVIHKLKTTISELSAQEASATQALEEALEENEALKKENNALVEAAKPKPQSTQPQKVSQNGNEKWRVSFYCNCEICCGKWAGGNTASGTKPKQGRTISVDDSLIPLGSKVSVDGLGDFVAEDTGSAIKGKRVDVYMDSHEEALKLGVQYREVERVND